MVSRSELSAVSCGYRVDAWEIRDEHDNILDPEKVDLRWDDTGLTFEATKWELLELSAVMVLVDASAAIRSLDSGNRNSVQAVRARMLIRERMQVRQAMHDAQRAFDLATYDPEDAAIIVEQIIAKMQKKHAVMTEASIQLNDEIADQ